MSANGSNRKSTSNSADVNSSRLIDPATLTELDPSDLMEARFEGDGLTDVEFKPGADFEVDDSLFQGVTMKEDFLDFTLSYADHAYCNAELEAPERSVGETLEVGNEEEIQEDVCLFEDVDDNAAVGMDETSSTSKKSIRIEESKAQDEGPSEDKKKVAVVKTYNMRSKRLAADGKGGQQDDASDDKKIQPAAKKRKVEVSKVASSEESSAEDEDDEDEATDSDEEVTVQSKRGRVQPKKGVVTKGKGKGKGKNAKGKKSGKGKQAAKKATKAGSDDEEENEDAEEPVTVKNSKKTNAKGKAGAGKRKTKPKKKPETETSEESEEESEESESEDEEMEEIPVKGARGNQKRTGKWKAARSVVKKRKATKKTAAAKAVDESESEETSSDDLPLQEVKKMTRKKTEAAKLKKMKKDDTEESSEEDQEEEEGDGNDDGGNVEIRSEKGQGRNRDPILSAFSKSPGVLMTDDSASICSTDDGTPGVRTSSRIKKPNRLYVMDSSSGLTVGKTNTATQKKEKMTKTKNNEQMTLKEAPVAGLDISETTDTDALVIDESPMKYPVAIGSIERKSLPAAANKGEEQHEAQVNEGEDEEDEREEEEESNNSGELTVGENQQMTHDPATSQTPDIAKRSARLKMIEEATQEKFKAFRAERERTEAKYEAQKKKSHEKFENDMEREEKPKPTTTKVAKDVPAKQSTVSAVKNPCRGPNCGKASLLGSVYCSDICIQNHALESIRLIEQERQKSQPQRMKTESSGAAPVQSKSDERIVVFERKTGKLLTGPVAPTESTLLSWLKKHPTFEVLQPSSHSPAASFAAKKDKKPEKKVPVKEIKPAVSRELAKMPAVPASQQRDIELPAYSGSSMKEDKLKTVMSHQHDTVAEYSKPVNVHRGFPKTPSDTTVGSGYSRGGPDPARISIRNTLRETLFVRANETDDVMLSGPEIKRLALDIEQELFGYYGEVNTKYKHKYRTLITHLKDPTNKGLFRKVLFGEIKPNRLVRLSSDSLGSRELAYWKDPNAKEVIWSRSFLELNFYHDEVLKPSSVQEQKSDDGKINVMQDNSYEPKAIKKAEFTPKSPYYDPSYDFLSSIIVDTTPQHGNHFFDINCKICTGKIPEPLYNDASKASHVASVVPKEEITPPVAIEAEPVVVHSKPTKDATIEFSRDPRRSKGAVTASSGTVGTSLTIVTSRTEEKSAILSPQRIVSPIAAQPLCTGASGDYQMGPVEPLVLWKGSMYAHDVAKVMVCAYLVSGSLPVLKEDLSDLIVISGRLPPENVYYYLSQIKQSGTFSRDIAIVRFESAGLQDDELYNQLFRYLNNRDRCGVVSGSSGPTVKDMYIVPVASHAGLPSILLPSDGPGLDDNHPNLLLGVIVKHSYRRPSVALSPAKPVPASAPASAPAPVPAMASSTKTWMYSERTEMKEELYPETKRSGTKHIKTTAQKSEPVEEYTPLLPTFESKALTASRSSSASKLAEPGNAESSGASDLDDTEDLSAVAHKDPIISKYSKFDKNSKTSTKKRARVEFDDEDKPYDPFDDDDDNKPYDPCSPEFVATTTAVAAATTITSTSSASSGMAVKYNPSSSTVAPSAILSPPQSLASSSPVTSIDLAQVLKPISGLSNTTDVTAAMLTTLAAISTTTNVEEQRRLLSELTEKINEQQVYLDKQKEDLKTKETQVGLSVSGLSSAGLASTGLASIGSGSRLGQLGFTSSSSSDASALLYSGTSMSVSGSGKAQGQTVAASNKTGTEVISLLGSSQTSVLSQIPVDSSAILNMARKRLAQKAGGSLSKWEPAPPVSVMKSGAEIDAEKLSWAMENLPQNADAQIGKKDTVTRSAFSCNLSVLPPSVQQLLSGSSFENLKNIVANVTGKKTSDEGGQSVEPGKTGEAAANINVQVKPDSERASEKKLRDATRNDASMSGAEECDKDTKPGGKNTFASNRHGDVDYRVQSQAASDAPLVSKGFEDITPGPSLSQVTMFPGYSGPNTLQYSDSRPQFPNPAAFGSSGPGLMGPGPAHLLLRPSEPGRSSESGRFRPSMQALLETPNDRVNKGPSDMKPALLKTPELLPVSEPKPNQEFPVTNQAPSTQPMQRPPFPPEMPRPPFPMDMQRPRFLSDMERPPFSAESQGSQLKTDIQRNPFLPQMPRPPLLPDIPQPPFPPQVPRPPFPPGMQRPPFMPEMPRPPFMPEMPRMCIPYKGPGVSGTESHLSEIASGSVHSEISSRLSTPGLLPAPKQLDSAGNMQDELSSPSDRYFAAKSMQQRNTPTPRTESNAGDASKPFSVGDFLKQLDSSRSQPPGFTSHSTKDSKVSSNNLQPPSSSDDATQRERKVLLPTPNTESMQKISEKSHDIKPRKIDEPKTSRVSGDQKQKPQVNKKPGDPAPAARRWSAKSDWEKNPADKSSSSDSAPVIVINETMEDRVELIPLPPGSSVVDKSDGNEAEVQIISYNAAGVDEKSTDGRRSERRLSQDRSQTSRSTDRSRSRSRREPREPSDFRSRRSDRGHRRSRSHDRHRRSRSKERSDVGQVNQRGRRRSRERFSRNYQPRSREGRFGVDQSKRSLRDQRHTSPSVDPRKIEDDTALQIRNSLNRPSTSSDQPSFERSTSQSNRPPQGSVVCGVDMHVPKPASVPSLIDMMQSSEPQLPKPAIPSLLDIMGVSRESISHSVRGGPDSKQNSRNTCSATSGTVDVKYRRDYKHGTDSEEGEETGRTSFARAPDFAERNLSFSGSHGRPDIWKQKDVETQPSESRDVGRQPPGGHGDFRRPERFPFERRDLMEERQASPMDVSAGRSYADSGNTFGRQYVETAGLPKRPLIDKPPERDFERPQFGRPMPNMGQEGTGSRGDMGPGENVANMPDVGYRSDERFGVGFPNREEGRNRGGFGPDGGRMPSDFPRMRPFPSHFSPEMNPEKQVHGAGPGGPDSTSMMGMEVDELTGRFSHPSMLKKSLLGDYPGTPQELKEETPVVTGHFESQARNEEFSRERNIGPDERRMSRPPLMPEPYHTMESKQAALMPEPRRNVEGKQTPPGWAADVGDGTSGQPRLLNMRFPSNAQGMRPGYGLVPPQRPPQASFGERGGFSQVGAVPRVRMPPEFGRAPEHRPQFSGGPESQSSRHNPALLDRLIENCNRQFPSAGMEGPPEGPDGISEKKTLLPVPPMPGPRLTEMGVRMGPGPRQLMPSRMDGPMLMARPGMRMPPRFPPHRPMGFSEGPRQPGLRQQTPGDPRPRGPSA